MQHFTFCIKAWDLVLQIASPKLSHPFRLSSYFSQKLTENILVRGSSVIFETNLTYWPMSSDSCHSGHGFKSCTGPNEKYYPWEKPLVTAAASLLKMLSCIDTIHHYIAIIILLIISLSNYINYLIKSTFLENNSCCGFCFFQTCVWCNIAFC